MTTHTPTSTQRPFGERVAQLAGVPHTPGWPPAPPLPPVGAPPRATGSAGAVDAPHAVDTPDVVDVIVVGSGGAALAAAAGALGAGASVAILEKGPVPGGTTACSGGVAHVYGNAVMRRAGISDPRGRALAYMARIGYPGAYDPEAPGLGLLPADLALLAAYFDCGAAVLDDLAALGAVRMEAPWLAWDGEMFPDYYEPPENAAPRGRGVQALTAEGRAGNGGELIRQLAAFAAARATPIQLGQRVVDLDVAGGTVVGVVVDDGARCRRLAARGGVVFGSGGFTHDPELRERFLRGPVVGGSGTPTNTGDLIPLAIGAGAALGGTQNAWWNQQVLEAAEDLANSVLDVWSVPGDSMVLVNRFGRRVVDEKREYQTRGRAHHLFEHDEYVNRVLFMVYDERTARRFGGRYPIPPPGAVADHVVRGEGIAGLAEALGQRLADRSRAPRPAGIAPVALGGAFADSLARTVARFNAMAELGVDDEFGRGSKAVEFAFHGPRASDNTLGNALLHPIDARGPLYAIQLVGAAFETNSGPRITADGQIVGAAGRPVPGLYGAGNCVDNVFGEGYPSGGATIGPGLVFGHLAGRHAAARAAAAAGAPGGR